MKQEKLAWLSNNPFYTKRFAFFVGRRCRTSTIQDVARELHLDWSTVKELDKQYMQEQLQEQEHQLRRRSASTRSRSARGTPTASFGMEAEIDVEQPSQKALHVQLRPQPLINHALEFLGLQHRSGGAFSLEFALVKIEDHRQGCAYATCLSMPSSGVSRRPIFSTVPI